MLTNPPHFSRNEVVCEVKEILSNGFCYFDLFEGFNNIVFYNIIKALYAQSAFHV